MTLGLFPRKRKVIQWQTAFVFSEGWSRDPLMQKKKAYYPFVVYFAISSQSSQVAAKRESWNGGESTKTYFSSMVKQHEKFVTSAASQIPD